MRFSLIPLSLALPFLTFAAPQEGGAEAPTPVAELVTYRLKDGVSPAEHVDAAKATRAFLIDTGAVLSRSLSVDENGVWTDHILWTSQTAAKAAEEQAMQRPEFGAFFAGMDESSITMRHAPVLMQME